MVTAARRRSSRSRWRSTSSTASTTPRTRSPPWSPRACCRRGWRSLWAAFFNFVAFLVFGTKVAATIAKDVVEPEVVDARRGVRRAGRRDRLGRDHLVARAADRRRRTRSSAGMAGAAVAKAGWRVARRVRASEDRRVHRALAAHRPAAGLRVMMGIMWLFHRYRRVDRLNRGSVAGSSSRRRRSASVTAPTTRRRRWASSSPC